MITGSFQRRGISTPIALVIATLLGGGLFAYLALFAKPAPDFTRDGDQIVAALDQYYEKTSVYPDALAALVPDYLPAVPVPADSALTDWAYAPAPTGREFTLAYAKPGVRGSTYTSSTRQWEADD